MLQERNSLMFSPLLLLLASVWWQVICVTRSVSIN